MKKVLNVQQLKNLQRIVMFLYRDMSNERKNEILKLFEESRGEDNMLAARRLIVEDRKECRAQGRAQGITQGILKGIRQTIERMVKMNFEDEVIEQATGAKKSEIEEIRKKVQEEK